MKRVKRLLKLMLAVTMVIRMQSVTVLAEGNVIEAEVDTMEKSVETEDGIEEEIKEENVQQENAEAKVESVGQENDKTNAENMEEENPGANVEEQSEMIEAHAEGSEVASGACGDNLTWELTEDGILTISGSGKMNDYKRFSKDHFLYSYKQQVKVVEIGEEVTYLGNEAFAGCQNLTEIKSWGGVTSIGDGVFMRCDNLVKVELPDTITDMGRDLFYSCKNLAEVKLPEGIDSIEKGTFETCENLTEIKIPDGVTSIGDNAFCTCISLKELKIPDGVTSIGNRAFMSCEKLTEIEIPDGVTSIEDYTFAYCSDLTEIKNWGGVTSIGEYAFYKCSNLIELEILGGVTSIGNRAFRECSNLAKIELRDGLLKIGGGAFSDCIGLTEIEIPDTVTEIGGGIFWGCSNLEKIKLSDGLVRIWDYAFRGCESLKEITIPSSVKHMGALAFDRCPSLETVYFEGNAPIFHREFENDKGEAIICENFKDVTARVYYPCENPTWTEENMIDYGGNLTWVEWNRAAELAIVLEATDKEYLIGSGGNAVIKCTGELKDFVSVAVDGEIVDLSCYTATEGSTVVTFLSAYLDSLSVGDHIVTLNYTYGSIDAVLTVIEKNEAVNDNENIGNVGDVKEDENINDTGNTDNRINDTIGKSEDTRNPKNPDTSSEISKDIPKTGDNIWMVLWVFAMMMAGSSCFVLLCGRREKRI